MNDNCIKILLIEDTEAFADFIMTEFVEHP